VLNPRPAAALQLRPLTAADLPAATDLSQAVQWPHRLEDWQFVLALGHGLAAYAGDRLVGTALWWTYERCVTRIGMVLVDPSVQRGGIGRVLMDAVLEQVTTPTVQLNATAAGDPLYSKLGFLPLASIVQHQGLSGTVPLAALRAGERIRPLGRNETASLITLDAVACGVRRPKVIEALIEHAEAVVLDAAGETAGFAFCRRFGHGQLIGPVVARDAQTAQTMLAHWIAQNTGKFTRVDLPADSGLSPWLDEFGFARSSPVNTMSRGTPLVDSQEFRTFALVSQALG
jgi:GNAT superfamily N-acetyltransferase